MNSPEKELNFSLFLPGCMFSPQWKPLFTEVVLCVCVRVSVCGCPSDKEMLKKEKAVGHHGPKTATELCPGNVDSQTPPVSLGLVVCAPSWPGAGWAGVAGKPLEPVFIARVLEKC